jgi:hypothetical protein
MTLKEGAIEKAIQSYLSIFLKVRRQVQYTHYIDILDKRASHNERLREMKQPYPIHPDPIADPFLETLFVPFPGILLR